jgi:murein DD-endopeptidase MepM/ murein hydrolase activator NlpD
LLEEDEDEFRTQMPENFRKFVHAALLILATLIGLATFPNYEHSSVSSNTAAAAIPPYEIDTDSAPRQAALDYSRSDSEMDHEVAGPIRQTLKVESGDTLMDMLVKVGISANEAHAAITALRKVYNPRELKPGHEINLTFDRDLTNPEIRRFSSLAITPEPAREVVVERTQTGGFAANDVRRPLSKELVRAKGTIDSSLYESAMAAGIPHRILGEAIKYLSFDIDFQREIQPGDGFEMMFERYYDEKGVAAKEGALHYISMTLSGKPYMLYRYASGNDVDFYTAKGESVRKALLKTPMDGAKITSKFGNRHHPILGYTKMHKGVDFGAAPGTPIQAAGEGTVEIAAFNGAYGNYVKIRHSSGYSTAYAHMSRFGAGTKKGVKVRQGQIIGYVGSTGRSTGPHLHYEIIVNNNQVNPLSVKMPSGKKLAGKELTGFNVAKAETDNQLAALPIKTQIASLR